MTAKGDHSREALLERAVLLKRAAAVEREADLPARPPDIPARLGAMQRGLWLLARMAPDSAAYNLTSVARLPMALDVDRLERAFQRLSTAHRILRSTFDDEGDEVVQTIRRPDSLRLEVVAVDGEPLLDVATREARRPFDLAAGPLCRLLLIRSRAGREEADRGDLLMLCLHHVIADERSLGLLWRDLAAAYDDPGRELAGRPQFDDWVHWDSRSGAADRGVDLEFWHRRLDPTPEAVRLPLEPPRTEESTADAAGTGGSGRLLRRPVGEAAARALSRLAAETSLTPFAILAFTFRLLLQRYVESARFAFGTPVSTRRHPATGEMVGYFLNPVTVPTAVDEDRDATEALRAFAADLRELTAHGALPFDALVESLPGCRRGDRHPLFQMMFVYQESEAPLTLDGQPLEPRALDLGEAKFDLTLFAARRLASSDRTGLASAEPERLEIGLEYRTRLFREAAMERLLDHYEALLARLGETPRARAADLDVLGEHERREVVALGAGPPLADAAATAVPDRIFERAAAQPDATAVVCGATSWSYGELARGASAIAAELSSRGIGGGDRVALFLDRSPHLCAAVLGVHWSGAAYVPLDPSYPEARNRAVLEDAGVSVALSRGPLCELLPSTTVPTIDVEALESPAEVPRPPRLALDSDAYLLYTSGSTGRPKGVAVTHENLRASTAARSQIYSDPPRRFLWVPSIAFDSSVAGLFWILSAGGALIVPTDSEATDPGLLARRIGEDRPDGVLWVPSLHSHLLETAPAAAASLRTVIVAGETCPPSLVGRHFELLPACRLFNEYGPTEATVWATVHELDRETAGRWDARRPVPIGRPIPGVRLEVRDARGRLVPLGLPGEAVIAGPTVARSHRGARGVDESRFGRDRQGVALYRTGDRVRWSADGELLFLGRADEQINLRGFRIEPAEIESALAEEPGVAEAAVVARPIAASAESGAEDRQLVAFVRVGEGEAPEGPSPEEWRHRLGQRLPSFMVPSRVVALPDLPRLPNGKVDRERLRGMPLSASVAAERRAPSSALEEALVALWEGLLLRGGIGTTDNFFELGGHSLLVFRMLTAIERDHGVRLAAADVFQSPTVRQLAQRLERSEGPEAAAPEHLFPIQPVGRARPLVVAIPHFFSGMLAETFRGERPVYGLRGVGLRPDGNQGRWATMEALGAELADEIQGRFPGRGCILAGYSFGASMAAAAARALERRSEPVHRLYLVAPMPLDTRRLGPLPLWLKVEGLDRPLDELPGLDLLPYVLRDLDPLTRRPYRRLWRFLKVQPRRRALCRLARARQRRGRPLTPAMIHADVRHERFRLHRGFSPAGIRTPTVIFNPRDGRTDAAATWRGAFEELPRIIEIPDPHDGDEALNGAKEIILRHIEELEGD